MQDLMLQVPSHVMKRQGIPAKDLNRLASLTMNKGGKVAWAAYARVCKDILWICRWGDSIIYFSVGVTFGMDYIILHEIIMFL